MKKKSAINSFFYRFLVILLKSLVLILICAALCACIGVSMDISIRSDNTGTMALEYRVSKMLANLGKLDGNERWYTIPVGRADFQRSMARLPGLRLSSFSSTDSSVDNITRAEIKFDNCNDLMDFLDSSQQNSEKRALYSRDGNKNRMFLVIMDKDFSINTDLLSLTETVFNGYTLNFSLSVPGNANLALTDASSIRYNTIPETIKLVPSGKKVSVKMDMISLFDFPEGLGLEFTW